MPVNPQIQNVVSQVVQGQMQLYEAISRLKALRTRLEDYGVLQMNQGQFNDALGLPDKANNLSHLTLNKLKQLIAAMDVLDAALMTPKDLNGQQMTPRKAIVEVIL